MCWDRTADFGEPGKWGETREGTGTRCIVGALGPLSTKEAPPAPLHHFPRTHRVMTGVANPQTILRGSVTCQRLAAPGRTRPSAHEFGLGVAVQMKQ